ncbi:MULTISPECIES: hypothetical protein [unclassified Francisella]|uniref:hypothetical protein n=1 Tax=unclassified Francisella TaxID=2610885 RepID=UPI002E372194|nr:MULTISPECIES: hypothetical protein [unclassified Francisella]MED7820246.1 hypothetical protein [Francisella sp. 19S2-4]MED7831081.1 hypothetical protein [Francisella sp. 19S2-10]
MLIRKHNRNRNGFALVMAIVIAVIFLSMSYLVYSLTHTNLLLRRMTTQDLQDHIALQQQFGGAISGSTLTYESNTPPILSNNHIASAENVRFNSFIVSEPGFVMRTIDYYLNIGNASVSKTVQVRVPSNTLSSRDAGINRGSIALNVPAINFDSLQAQQLNSGSGAFADNRVGYIGDIAIDSNSEELTFSRPGFDDLTLDISNQLTNGGTYALSQGWRLNDGNWEVSLGVYDASNNSESGCVITTSLNDFIANFNGQNCIALNNTGIIVRPDQEFLNCFGAFPNLDNFEECREREWWSPEDPPPNPPYEIGDICHQDGILFIAIKRTVDMPLRAEWAWRPFYPDDNWVQPYHPDVQYAIGNKIIFDGRRYIMNTTVDSGRDPYSKKGAGWRVDDVYPWHNNITYKSGDIVIRDYQFYRAKWEHSKKDPLTAGQWGEWAYVGYVNDDLTALDYLNTCDNTVTPTQQYLNCYGAYPATGGRESCSETGRYTRGDECVYEGLLMGNVSLPFFTPTTGWPGGSDANYWRVVYPNNNWVMPYNNNVRYNVGARVIWRDKRFELIKTVELISQIVRYIL